jgi:tRNA A-37 threonylcarbamoyl transferase component Bud32
MATLAQLQNGELQGIKRLQISEALKSFPIEIFNLADTLEILDLSGNCLTDLPEDLPRLHQLKVIFCSNNLFKHLPPVLGKCPNLTMVGFKANQINKVESSAFPPLLQWLILTDNQIDTLPDELGNCSHLQKLMLAGNKLTSLPTSLKRCVNLELIRFSSNCLTKFPSQLLNLPHLAWMAFSDNPFCADSSQSLAHDNSFQSYDWDEIQLGALLGEGASGSIYQAKMPNHFDTKELAIKVFKGAMTSDGVPESELISTLIAGLHQHLIPLVGQVKNHPSGVPALVMEKLDSAFVTIAAPPSLSSCTRDIYSKTQTWTIEQIWFYAKSIATVMAYLHKKGIMHGDLYAHNILIKDGSSCYLSDFGAASIYRGIVPSISQQLEAIEVRAYAVLLQELLSRLNIHDENRADVKILKHIINQCIEQNSVAKLFFNQILDLFSKLNEFGVSSSTK